MESFLHKAVTCTNTYLPNKLVNYLQFWKFYGIEVITASIYLGVIGGTYHKCEKGGISDCMFDSLWLNLLPTEQVSFYFGISDKQRLVQVYSEESVKGSHAERVVWTR